MGVYIPGIKMPKSCPKCRDSGLKFAIDELGLKCPERKELWGPTAADIKGIRRADCPLIFVQAHGRIGDLDALKETIESLIEKHLHGYTKSTWDFVCELRSIISTAPTIIPAEEGEE